ncbi:MAG: multi-sensor signal transduction histidine [Planctomycetota bacterium]|nr:MAG: multi-sensor signal transduction histidine [Planctomycetota bacterium]
MKRRVLVIDDSLTVRGDLEEALSNAGFEVAAVETLADARKILAEGTCDLVVLDVLLPDGDGVDFLREIRTLPCAPTPVMLLSTESEVKDRIRGLRTGADDYVGKPYDRDWLVSRARELTRRPGEKEPAPFILVIDDSPTVREELRGTLTRAGYEVATADSGEAGLRLAANHRPAAVIVDSALPGIDGATVIRRLRQDTALRRLPVMLLTASEGRGFEVTALDAGADAYVRKDDGMPVVLARLGAMLRASGAPAPIAEPASLGSPKRILAVDDSETYLQVLAGQLRGEGYEVAMARSGAEALQLLEVQPVDCVLLDLLMPGLSGTETCRAIKKNPGWRDMPLIMLTALDEREAMIEGINAGADDYITKSADFEVLRARLRAQLRRKQFEEENRHIREELGRREKEAVEERAARVLAETRSSLMAELEKKNLELEAFSYSVSHDLRAPLRAIDGYCAAIQEDCAERLDDAGRGHFARVRKAAGRMGRLIDDLLAFSRVGRLGMTLASVDMQGLVGAAIAELREQNPSRPLEFTVDPLPRVHGDSSLLGLVVQNLLSNAVKYSAGRAPAFIRVAAEDRPGETVFSVRDNGVGFDPQYTHKLFGVFQRLHRADEFEGTGVGLALVKRIVERHGGRVWAEGTPGAGAAFHFAIGKEALRP